MQRFKITFSTVPNKSNKFNFAIVNIFCRKFRGCRLAFFLIQQNRSKDSSLFVYLFLERTTVSFNYWLSLR